MPGENFHLFAPCSLSLTHTKVTCKFMTTQSAMRVTAFCAILQGPQLPQHWLHGMAVNGHASKPMNLSILQYFFTNIYYDQENDTKIRTPMFSYKKYPLQVSRNTCRYNESMRTQPLWYMHIYYTDSDRFSLYKPFRSRFQR